MNTMSTITAVLDRDDDVSTHRHIAGLAAAPDTLVVELRPNPRRIQQVAEDVLAALEKDMTRRGADRNGQESWAQATAWVIGERIDRVIVTRCHTMSSGYVELFVELAALAKLELTFVYGSAAHNRTTRDALTRLSIPIRTLEQSDLQTSKKTAPKPRRRGKPKTVAPRPSQRLSGCIPDDDFPTFYHAAKGALSPADFGVVNSIYGSTIRRALVRWQGQPRDAEAVAVALRDCVESARDSTELTIQIRALQASAAVHGFLLVQRVGTPVAEARPSADDAAALAALRRYASTRHAALGLLALLIGPNITSLAAIRVRDVVKDGMGVSIGGHEIDVPSSAAGVLRSHRLRRLMAGATQQDGLINADTRAMRDTGTGTIAGPTAILRLLRDIEAETGLHVAARWNRRAEEPTLNWAKRAGFLIRPIPTPI